MQKKLAAAALADTRRSSLSRSLTPSVASPPSELTKSARTAGSWGLLMHDAAVGTRSSFLHPVAAPSALSFASVASAELSHFYHDL